MKYLGPPQSGSIADQTFSRNQFCQYVRDRTAPTQPSSIYAHNSRTFFAACVAAWSTITDAQRNAWEDYAQRFSRADSLGRKRVLGGRQVFLKVNQAHSFYGPVSTPLADPPPSPVYQLRAVDVYWSGVSLVADWSPAGVGQNLVLYGSAVVSNGCMRPTSAGRLLVWQAIDPSSVTPPFSTGLAANWAIRFGALPSPGQVSWFGWREYSNGWLSPLISFRVERP